MTDQVNIISICCDIFFDINNYSKKSDSDQIDFGSHINDLNSTAFKYIGQTNRIILTTRNGTTIAYMGSPDDAMLMAIDIRNEILIANKHHSAPLSVCIGIHLEQVGVVNEFNEQSNIIGDGINAAKRIMSHAKVNEILVSRSYYENTTSSTQQISTMFDSACLKQENHVLEYQVHLVNRSKNLIPVLNQSLSLDHRKILTETLKPSESSGFLRAINRKYAVACSFFLVALFALVKLAIAPEPTKEVLPPHKTVENLALEKKIKTKNLKELETKSDLTLEEESRNDKKAPLIQEKVAHKKSGQKNVKTNQVKKNVQQKLKKRIDTTAKNNKTKEIISWKILKDSIRQGQKHECTQSEIALNQCD